MQKPSESSHITTECLPSSTPSKPSPHRLKQENLPNDTDPSDASDLAASTQSKQTPLSSIPTPSAHPTPPYAPDPPSKDTHNSHTRRCRAKVNLKFAELLSVLPAPPPKAGIKHKAQILDYTINVFRDILARKTLLEAELTLSSKTHLNNWVDNVVNHSMSIQEALAPYLSLICTKGKWKYSEIWVPSQEPLQNLESSAVTVESVSGDSQLLAPPNPIQDPQFRLRLALGVIPSLPNSEEPDLQAKLERFRDRSRSFGCKASVDLPGRIMCTMRPEWLPSLEDQHAFQRAKLAREASLVICFGVPIFVRGHVAAVAVFFDTEQRAYDAPCVDLADHVAGLLGNSFGASIVKRAASK